MFSGVACWTHKQIDINRVVGCRGRSYQVLQYGGFILQVLLGWVGERHRNLLRRYALGSNIRWACLCDDDGAFRLFGACCSFHLRGAHGSGSLCRRLCAPLRGFRKGGAFPAQAGGRLGTPLPYRGLVSHSASFALLFHCASFPVQSHKRAPRVIAT